MKRRYTSSSGFTLIELLIVMVILSILAVIVTGTFSSSMRRGRDTRRKNDLRAIASAIESYYNDKGRYPLGLNGVMMGCAVGGVDDQACVAGGTFQDSKGTIYMTLIPSDPLQTYTYYYYSTTGTGYRIYAHLENTLDTGTNVNQSGYSIPTGNKCGVATMSQCTFAVVSPNVTP
jgi:prepilin-type N-terminal cleavage/methylation domain-containing protein